MSTETARFPNEVGGSGAPQPDSYEAPLFPAVPTPPPSEISNTGRADGATAATEHEYRLRHVLVTGAAVRGLGAVSENRVDAPRRWARAQLSCDA
jgi:hypothetical protein